MKAVKQNKTRQQRTKGAQLRFLPLCLILGFVVGCSNFLHAQPSSRDNPLPLLNNELKGNIAPNTPINRFYSFEAGPGDVGFSLEVKTNEQWSNIGVEILDTDGQPLIKFDASSGGDKRDAKLRLEQRQAVTMRVFGPRNNQSGFFTLKLRGPVFFNKTLASNTNTPKRNDPALPNNAPPVEKKPEATTATNARSDANTTVNTNPNVTSSGVNEISTSQRVALVIGNSNYQVGPLANPANDAKAMAQTLRESGFDVMEYTNLNKRGLEEALRAFGSKIPRGGVALFYFAGHGVQVKGVNFLLPIGARIEKEGDIEFEAVDAGRIMNELESAGSRLNIVVLDACRNNPFAQRTRSLQRGLAVMSAPSGTVVAYATGPGEVASDGDGNNGLYTQELIKNIREPNVRIEDVLKRTRIAVKEKTNGQQVPWENTSLDGDFYFRKQ
ncbi:MAG TPA: caspase domain-containing protein [Blastocatellia bacterium]|nr:caspase domain-containing protein [Blastocatellia bacterium]